MSATQPEPADWRIYHPLRFGPVLAAAIEAFVEVGYHGAAIRNIARRSGLSVPGLYHHYESKQAILAEILDVTMDDLLWRSRVARREGGTDCVTRFALLVECLTLYHTYRRDLAFIGASEMRSLTVENRERIAALRAEQQRMVDAEVDQAIAERRFTTSHPHEASRAVVTMCTAIPQWYRPKGPLTPEQIADRYVEFALRLMGHSGPAPRLQPA